MLTGHRYGFIKYYSFADAENCIRGFYSRGYEAKFAKVGPPAYLTYDPYHADIQTARA